MAVLLFPPDTQPPSSPPRLSTPKNTAIIPGVPFVSYGAATLVGLSRVTENKHWISDVFAGAALGYITGLQVVRNYHRYAYLQNHKPNKGSVSFNLQFNYDHLEPGVSYRFR